MPLYVVRKPLQVRLLHVSVGLTLRMVSVCYGCIESGCEMTDTDIFLILVDVRM